MLCWEYSEVEGVLSAPWRGGTGRDERDEHPSRCGLPLDGLARFLLVLREVDELSPRAPAGGFSAARSPSRARCRLQRG